MTKEIFLTKWVTDSAMVVDLEAVIAKEVAKAWELEPVQGIPQPALNPIEEAYERGEKIRRKDWNINSYTRKYDLSAKKQFTWHGERINPEDWELYTEPDQVTDHEQPAKPFDKDRFERMFCAVLVGDVYENAIKATEDILAKLDAYYASKEGGANE